MRNRIITLILFAALSAGTLYTVWMGQPIAKAEAETAQPIDSGPATWPTR